MKKRILTALLVGALCLALVGCDAWTDDEGRHFMLFGERGPSGLTVQSKSEDDTSDGNAASDSTAPYALYDSEAAITGTDDDGVVSALTYKKSGGTKEKPTLLERFERSLSGSLALEEFD